MDVIAGLKAAEASQRVEEPLLAPNNNNALTNAEAGPPLTPLSQLHLQQAQVEPSPIDEKQAPKEVILVDGQNRTTLATITAALEAVAAAAPSTQRTAGAGPLRSTALPAPRQNPIITNAMSAVEEHGPWLRKIPSVPVYTPTAEEWKDPLAYIRSIQPEAGKYGACVVKSPITPAVPAALLLKDLRFTTRIQKVKIEPWGKTWEDGIKFYDSGRKCTLLEYAKLADEFARRKLGLAAELPTTTVESIYWREKESSRTGKDCTVEYGNDIEGSAFHPQDPLGQTNWNLNSFSDLPGSALRWCNSPSPGVTTPMLYIGMLYATFAWHVEDHFMYSINYSHAGASKVWYCVPASAADDLESTAAEIVYRDACASMVEEQGTSPQAACNEAVAEALAGKTTSMSPRYLVDKGIPVYRAVQEAGSYVITFPRSYHSGFSTGFNLGEAVNFVLSDWWPFGEHARRLYKIFKRQQIVSHEQVLCDDAIELADKLEQLPEMKLSEVDKPVAVAFVAMMQRVHRLRKKFQAQKVVEVAACSPSTPLNAPEMRDSIPCNRCSHLSYLASAVVDARKPQNQWEHVCLECASASAAVGKDSSIDPRIIYVKPLWCGMENRAKMFASLLVKQDQLQSDGTSSGGSGGAGVDEAAVQHQMLSLDGCSKAVLEDPETLSKFTWADFDDVMLFAPAWVGKPEAATSVDGAGFLFGGGSTAGNGDSQHFKPMQVQGTSIYRTDIINASHIPHRKRSREEGEDDDGFFCIDAPPAASVKKPYKNYLSSESSLPTLESTLVRKDAVKMPGKGNKTIVPRRIFKLRDSGQLVIQGSDIVKAIIPHQSRSASVSRWLGRKLFVATNSDSLAPDKYLVFIESDIRKQRIPAVGKNGAKVLLRSEKMKSSDEYGAFCAILKGVWKDLDDGKGVEEEEEVVVPPVAAPASNVAIEKLKKARKSHPEASSNQVFFLQNGEKLSSSPFKAPPRQPAVGAGAKHQDHTPSKPGPVVPQPQEQTPEAKHIGHLAHIIIEDIGKGVAKYAANTGEEGVRLQEAPGSTATLKRYYLPNSDSSSLPPSSSTDTSSYTVVVASYHAIVQVLKATNRVSTIICRWIKRAACAPGVTKNHILCLAPLFYYCENWKKFGGKTFVFTIEQCAVIYLFGLEGQYLAPMAKTEQKNRLYRTMVSVWGENAVLKAIEKVNAANFVSTTSLRPQLRQRLMEAEATMDGANKRSTTAVNDASADLVEEDQGKASDATASGLAGAVALKIAEEEEEAEQNSKDAIVVNKDHNGNKFTSLPSLFNGDGSLPISSQPPMSTLNGVEFPAVSDPEEVNIEIEAENNRSGGSGGEKASSGGPAAPAPTEEGKEIEKKAYAPEADFQELPRLPPLEEDILDLMEAEVAGAGAPQHLPPPPPPLPGAEYFGSQPEHVEPPSNEAQYNAYHALALLYPPAQQYRQQQQQAVAQLHRHHQQMMALPDAPIVSLQSRQIMLRGNTWDGSTHMVDNNHQMGIISLYNNVAPPPPPPPPRDNGNEASRKQGYPPTWNMQRW